MKEVTSSNVDTFVNSENPVVIDFHAPWCSPCKALAPVLESLQQKHPDVVVCSVNVDTQPQLAEMFSISSLPTVLICKRGEVSKKMIGLSSLSEFEQALSRA